MSKFCVDNCNNLLDTITGVDKFYYRCKACGMTYEPTAEDTRLVHDVMTASDSDKYKDLMSSIIYDQSVPDVFITEGCKKCKSLIVKKIRIQDNLMPTYICKCGYTWSVSK